MIMNDNEWMIRSLWKIYTLMWVRMLSEHWSSWCSTAVAETASPNLAKCQPVKNTTKRIVIIIATSICSQTIQATASAGRFNQRCWTKYGEMKRCRFTELTVQINVALTNKGINFHFASVSSWGKRMAYTHQMSATYTAWMKSKRNETKWIEIYTGNERSRAVKLRAAVLGVADIAHARNSHSDIPTLITSISGALITIIIRTHFNMIQDALRKRWFGMFASSC